MMPRLKMLFLILAVAVFAGMLSFWLLPTESVREETGTTEVNVPPAAPPVALAPTASLSFASNGDGTCTVVGLGASSASVLVIPMHSSVGDRVTAIASRAFFGCESIQAIHIPESVEFIGTLAFGACPNLAFVSVSAQNPSFTALDGVLYSKDLSTLYLYPPMHGARTLRLSRKTLSISEMAFYRAAYLQSLTYEGSAEDWERISIAPKNYALNALAKVFEGDRG